MTLAVVLLIVGRAELTAQGNELYATGDNYRIYPSAISQTEVFIVNSPIDNNILFASCNTLNFIPFFVSEGIYVSTDEGQSWQGSDTCSGEPIAFHGGDPGIAIDKDGTFVLTRLGRSPFSGLYSHYSTDNGQTWSAQKVISTDDLERAVLASDIYPESPYYGRTYAAWVKFSPPFPLMIAYTDDGGVSWSTPSPINNPPNRSAGGDLVIGPGGVIHACWAGVTDVSPFKEIHAGHAWSDDGGSSWQVNEIAFPMNGITGTLPEKGNIRVNGYPNIEIDTSSGNYGGRVYIVSGQKNLAPAGSDPDIILNYSDDMGQNWSAGIRVNQDPASNGRIQYFPAIHVDRFGGVDILFYDDRNTTSDSAGVFLARSTDGGSEWKEYEISDHNYKPEPIGGLGQGYQGDNIDLTSTNTGIWPVWMDNSTGNYQVWTTPVSFSSLDNIDEAGHVESIELLPARPNPFRGHCTIYYRLKADEWISVKVYDLGGKLESILFDGHQAEGEHRVVFNPSKPGLYICRIVAGRSAASQKVIALPD